MRKRRKPDFYVRIDKYRPIKEKRDVSTITNRDLLFFDKLLGVENKKTEPRNDLRRYDPVGNLKYVDGRHVRYELLNKTKRNVRDRAQSDRISFEDSDRVIVCHRRKSRRETLFAKRKIGSGRKVSKHRRWTERSKIVCS